MPYKPTGRPNGRPRLHPKEPEMAKTDETVTPQQAAAPAAVPVTETPEFKAAQAAMEAKFDAFKAELMETLGSKTTSPGLTVADLKEVFQEQGRAIALANAEIADQGTDRKRVAPEELAARGSAFERMGTLIQAAQAGPKGSWPRYKLIAKTLLNDRVIDPLRRTGKGDIEQVHILHCGIPSLAMRPVDDAAKAIYREFVRYLGGSESANSVAPSSPVWMTMKGTILANGSTATARGAGLEFAPEPILIEGEELPSAKALNTTELISPTDPRAKEFNVLGTIADTAKVGQVESRVI